MIRIKLNVLFQVVYTDKGAKVKFQSYLYYKLKHFIMS